MTFLSIALDRDLVVQTRHDDLPSTHVRCAMHGHEIAIQNPGVPHAHAVNPQQEMRWLSKQIRIDLITSFDVLLGQNRLARGNTPYQGQTHLLA